MKLVTFLPCGSLDAMPRVGVLSSDGTEVIDVSAADRVRDASNVRPAWCVDMLAVLDDWDRARERIAACLEFVERNSSTHDVDNSTSGPASPVGEQLSHPLDKVRLLSPVPRPRSIRDCMLFEQHLTQCRRQAMKRKKWLLRYDRLAMRLGRASIFRPPRAWYERPIYYKGNPASVVGHEADVVWPAYTERLDYELEFGLFIGRRGANIKAADASRYIAGYAIFNDFSARDVQLREMRGWLGPAKGKDFDTGNAIGPWLVTADEIPDPNILTLSAYVNGERWSHSTSRGMRFSLPEVIEYISRDETLYPGDFIAAGTVGGGCGLELDRWLKPGDVVELEVSGLGRLRNRVVRRSAQA